MAKFEITFSQETIYTMTISAKNDSEAHEKFYEKIDSLTDKQLEKLVSEHGDFKICGIDSV